VADRGGCSARCAVRGPSTPRSAAPRCCACRTAPHRGDLAGVLAGVGVDADAAGRRSHGRPRGAARRCTTARTAARRRSAGDRRRRRASARSAPRWRASDAWVDSRSPGGIAGRARPSSPCRSWRGCRCARRRRTPRRCDAPSPCRGSRWCRRATARPRQLGRRSARRRRARPRTATPPGAASRAARDRRRGRGPGSGRCGRGPGPGPASPRSRWRRRSRSRAGSGCTDRRPRR
jgi:hypothetical protein